ncbi:MAG TPA: nicotinate (nicotinamide) nucleotide adenylyltransferase [Candidatus Saccharimonadales bacterium]|nr:nicotinate (nicotinamide) nucleotide adenylyltransferase [Candidatus Saccharimonadales bacterium]
MNIAVLGGSFDPPHIGHYFVLKQILELRPDIDKILLMPVYQHQWKPVQASITDRLNMLACLTNERVEISDIEIKRKGISYTKDTVKEIKKQTKANVYWVVGSDIVAEYEKWDNTDDLFDFTTFLVFPRDPYHIPQNLPKGFEIIDDKNLITTNISSTVIRNRIKVEKAISYLVPKEVEAYIQKNGLYK